MRAPQLEFLSIDEVQMSVTPVHRSLGINGIPRPSKR
jgi:hypothetical protein